MAELKVMENKFSTQKSEKKIMNSLSLRSKFSGSYEKECNKVGNKISRDLLIRIC